MIDELKEEIYLYNLLRQLFLKEPNGELLSELAKINISDDNQDEVKYGLMLMAESAKKNKNRIENWEEELATEYARLFLGPQRPAAVPYASFYLSESKTLMTEETINVRKKYLEAGMVVRDLCRIPDDHVGIEIEFIFYLTQRIIELFESEQREEASKLFEIRSSFLSEHMKLWVCSFADNVLEATKEDFFRGAAHVLKGVICSK